MDNLEAYLSAARAQNPKPNVEFIRGDVRELPFPDGFRTPDTSFDGFERALRERGIEPQNVAGVMLETYQGGSSAFAPVAYMQALRQWCTGHKALLVCDEIQAGFGRRHQVGTRWLGSEVFQLPEGARMMRGREATVRILLQELA